MRAANTQNAYASDWADFCGWCRAAGREALPATAETVRLYLVSQLEVRALTTVQRRDAAIRAYHRDAGESVPVDDESRAMMRGARRQYGRPPRKKAALMVDELSRMVGAIPKGVHGMRDKAVLLLGFASALRRSELVALNIEDVEVTPKGLVVRVARSKTDQEGRGREIGIPPASQRELCPVRAVEEWLWISGRGSGPLFVSCGPCCELTKNRLTASGVAKIVKRCVERVGLEGEKYGAHSLRAGMVTAALESGVPESIVMQRSGHKSVKVLHGYLRSATIWRSNPLAAVL